MVTSGAARPEQLGGVRAVALSGNPGFAAAVNAGASVAEGELLVLLNDDAVAEPDWLAELVASIDRHPKAAAATSKVLRADDPAVIDGAGDSLTRALKAYRRGQGSRDGAAFAVEQQVFSASGTACIWRSDVFRGLGGFDETFVAYYEDVELGFRARTGGHECWYAPRAVVLHVGGATARTHQREFRSFHAVRNRWRFIVTDVPRAWLIRQLHWIVLGEIISLIRAGATRELRLMLKAYGDILAELPRLRAVRAERAVELHVGYSELLQLAPRRFPPLQGSLWRLQRNREHSQPPPASRSSTAS